MATVSANTLFHFTTFLNLKNILKTRYFYAQYSEEHFEEILPDKSYYKVLYTPLISFCDLTIMQLSDETKHTKRFGKYGIGLKKEWGIEKKISPVTYVHKNSHVAKQLNDLRRVVREFTKEINQMTVKETNTLKQVRLELLELFKYIKPYSGYYHKGVKQDNLIPYYDEREWRYVPPTNYPVLSGFKRNKEKVVQHNSTLKKKFLKFSPDMVKFILIDKKDEISEIVKAIDSMSLSATQRSELITKIRTFEEIKDDY